MKGCLRIGDTVEILPGFISKGENTTWRYQPITSVVESMNSEKTDLEIAIPGGLIGVKLNIDPFFTTNDGLSGSIMTTVTDDGENPYSVYETIYVTFDLVERYDGKLFSIKRDDEIVLNHNACNIKSQVVKINKNKMQIKLLEKPICGQIGDYITVSKVDQANTYNLVARAQIQAGDKSELQNFL
jgi:translation initiation factor 2 subunit 3